MSDAANRKASHRRLAANRRDSAELASNVKLKSTTTTRMNTTVVVRIHANEIPCEVPCRAAQPCLKTSSLMHLQTSKSKADSHPSACLQSQILLPTEPRA